MPDEAKCTCGRNAASKLSEHAEDCHYRLKHDKMVVKMDFTEEELLAGLYLTQRLNANDHDAFMSLGGETIHNKFFEAVKVMASLKSTGKLPKDG